MKVAIAILASFAATSAAIKVKGQSEPTLEELLWDGQDVDDPESLSNGTNMTHLMGQNSTFPTGAKRVIVMGAMDTGTNLMDKMLQINFPDFTTFRPIWKHTVNADPTYLQRRFENAGIAGIEPENMVLVIMTRSPIAQYSSWKKAPYEMRPCLQRSFSEWDTECTPQVWGATDLPTTFASTLDIYNMYVKQTFQVSQHSSFYKVLPIAYEDVVYSPQEVFANIASAANWPMPSGGINVLEQPAKNHGHAGGRTYALNKLRTRSFLNDFQPEERAAICSHIEPQWTVNMVEGSMTSTPRKYMEDCSSTQ